MDFKNLNLLISYLRNKYNKNVIIKCRLRWLKMYINNLISELKRNGIVYVDGLNSIELRNMKKRLHEQYIEFQHDICSSRIIKK